jgi:hypothetical protein
MSRIRTPLAFTAVGVLAVSVVGALVADADGIASFASAVGPSGSKLSVPLPVLLVEVGGALGAAFARLPVVRYACGIPSLLASLLSLAAFAADGDLDAAGLTSAQVGYQALIGVTTLALLVLTVARLYKSRRALTAVP